MHKQAATMHFNNQIYWPFALLTSLPHWLALVIAPNISLYTDFVLDCGKAIEDIKNGSCDPSTRQPIQLLKGDVPASEKSIDRLVQEAQVVVSAGTETTSWCLSVITFHLLSNPAILKRLRTELGEAIPDADKQCRWRKLSSFPILLRVSKKGCGFHMASVPSCRESHQLMLWCSATERRTGIFHQEYVSTTPFDLLTFAFSSYRL